MKREVAQHATHHVGQHIDRRLAALLHAIGEVLAFGRLRAFERRHLHAVLLREAGRGWRRLAVRLERRRHGRTRDQFFEIRLTLGDTTHARRQTTWRAVGLGTRVAREPRLFEARVHVLGHLRRESRQPAGGNLLAADFDQQLTVHRY